MAERHDNSRPATTGTISLNRLGVFNYFPIEQSAHLKPFWGLFLHQRLDGEIVSSLDMRLMTLDLFDE